MSKGEKNNELKVKQIFNSLEKIPDADFLLEQPLPGLGGWGALPNRGYIGMCRCERYGFQAVYSVIGYIDQRV